MGVKIALTRGGTMIVRELVKAVNDIVLSLSLNGQSEFADNRLDK